MAKKSTATPVAKAPKANPKPAPAKAAALKTTAREAAVVADTAAAVREAIELPAAGPTTAHVSGQLNGHSPA